MIYTGQRVLKTVKAADGRETKTVYLDKYSELRNGQLVKYAYLGESRVARIGGSLPKAVSLAGLVTGPGASALAGVALVLALLLSMVRPVRRFARGALAVSLSLVMASCGTCGGPPGPPAGTLFYVENHLGSAVAQLDTESRVVGESNFDVWGNPIVLTDEPYGFTGAEYDAEAGLQYLGSRYYDVKLGRFISVDEVVIDRTDVAGDDGQLLNVYSYARNTPTSLADRGGKLPHILVGALIGAAINTGIYLAKAAYNDTPITAKGALTAAVVGGVTGAVAAATGGAGLYASGAISGVVGGVLERGIETGSAAEAFSPERMVGDAATGAVTAGIVKAATPAVTKVVGGVVQRLGGAVKQAVESIKPRCAGNCGTTIGCFVAGTPVLMASGVLVPIEEVAEGDRVAAANEGLGWSVGAYAVTQSSVREVDVVVDLDVRDDSGAVERVTTTLEHPFAVLRGGPPHWVPAGELREGDALQRASGLGSASVVRVAQRREATAVYNLTVENAHAYFVGAEEVLVHNVDCPPKGGPKLGPTEAYNRAKHYGRTPTQGDRTAVGAGKGQVADHDPPLVKRYYEGDPAKGEKPGWQMTPQGRAISASDRTRMGPQSRADSNAQGADECVLKTAEEGQWPMSKPSYLQLIEEHYTEAWSAPLDSVRLTRGPIAELPECFGVLVIRRTPEMIAYATECMSQLMDSERIELHVLTRASREASAGIIEILTAVAHYHRTCAPLALGHTVNFGKPWLAGSACAHGLISLPYLDGPSLEWLKEPAVRFLWLVPITESELQFKKTHGQEALEVRLEESRFDYLDPLRSSVV